MFCFIIGGLLGGAIGVGFMCLFQAARQAEVADEKNSNPPTGFYI